MDRIHERICPREAANDRAIDAGTVGRIRVTLAAVVRRGNVANRL